MSSNKQKVENLLKIVAKKNNIENYSLIIDDKVSISEDGFLSEFCTGGIKILKTGEIIRFYFKLSSNQTNMATTLPAIFSNEITFYDKLFPALDAYQRKTKNVKEPFNKIPKFYYGFCDGNHANSCIILEDLIKNGYVLYDTAKYFEAKHLQTIFYEFGKFHALGFAYKHENPEKYKEIVTPVQDVFGSFFRRTARITKKTLDTVHWENENVASKVKNLSENFTEEVNKALYYRGKYSTLLHGDCWANNIMFKFSNDGNIEDMKLIDFQMVQDSTPVHDLSYILYSGGSKQDFDRIEDYLKIYYESFRKFSNELDISCPETLLPFESFKEDWKSYSLFGILLAILVSQVKLLPESELKDWVNTYTNEEIPSLPNGEKWLKNTKKFLEGDALKKVMNDLFNHAVEYGIL